MKALNKALNNVISWIVNIAEKPLAVVLEDYWFLRFY